MRPLVRPAVVTLRGLAEVDPKDRMQVVAVHPWKSLEPCGTGFRPILPDGGIQRRDERALVLQLPNGGRNRTLAVKLWERSLRRSISDGNFDRRRVYSPLPRRARVANSLVLLFVMVMLMTFTVRVATEIWPWFAEFTLGLQILTLLAVAVFVCMVVPFVLIELISTGVFPRDHIRRARWTSQGVEGELDSGERGAQRWSDLVLIKPSSTVFVCSFSDGGSVALPRSIQVSAMLRLILERWPMPAQVERARRRMWVMLLAFFLLFNLAGAVAAAGALESGPRQNGLTSLQAYLVMGWAIPVGFFVFMTILFRKVHPWLARIDSRVHSKRARQHLRYPDETMSGG